MYCSHPLTRSVFLLLLLGLVTAGCDSAGDNGDETPIVAPGGLDPAIRTWLQQTVIPFETVEPNDDFSDLQPLKDIIGDARIVSLGEATHGTREFFQMKHRLLKFLVEEMEFTAFAIEATMPESFFIDDYVRTGEGDPAKLLAGLYFWTWNTQEVLDMILWMRQHNEQTTGPGVGFFGFDMQYPREAMDHVSAYLESVQPDSLDYIREMYDCFRAYQGNVTSYSDASFTIQNTCATNVEALHNFMEENKEAYEAQTSPEAFALALHHARLVIQAEDAFSSGPTARRDDYMAENTRWLLDEWLGPDDKIVLWAHNYHVAVSPGNDFGTQGTTLRRWYGDDMVIMGFNFYTGTFNARIWANGQIGALQRHTTPVPLEDTYAYHFDSARIPLFFLNLQGLPQNDPALQWLYGPRRFRSIGAAYNSASDDNYYYQANVPEEFDVVIYIRTMTPSVLLPFTSAAGKMPPGPPLFR